MLHSSDAQFRSSNLTRTRRGTIRPAPCAASRPDGNWTLCRHVQTLRGTHKDSEKYQHVCAKTQLLYSIGDCRYAVGTQHHKKQPILVHFGSLLKLLPGRSDNAVQNPGIFLVQLFDGLFVPLDPEALNLRRLWLGDRYSDDPVLFVNSMVLALQPFNLLLLL